MADRQRARVLARRWPEHEALGRLGEDLAHRYLQKRGYTVVARNWRPGGGGSGEIDVVALKDGVHVFVEVKTRRRDDDAAPARAIDETKMRGWRYAARAYLRQSGADGAPARMDLVEIVLEPQQRLEHTPDAFRLQ